MCQDIRKTPFRSFRGLPISPVSQRCNFLSIAAVRVSSFQWNTTLWGNTVTLTGETFDRWKWREKQGRQTSSFTSLRAFHLLRGRISQCLLRWNKMSGFHLSLEIFICECCSPFYWTYIKPAHLLPGKSSWIIISHFSNSQHFCCKQTLGAGLIMLFACLRTTFFFFFFAQQPLHPCAFHCLKGP